MMKKQNKIYLAIVIVAVVLIAAIAMFSTPQEEETKTIGAILPLSGPGAFLGQQFQKGMILATEEINSEKNELNIIYEDSKSDPKEGISAYQKITTTSNPQLIISAFSGVSLALIPLVEEDNLPLMMGIVSGSEYAKKSEMAFRYFTNADIEAPIMANYMRNQLNTKKFSVLYIDDEYGNDYYNKFKETYESLGGEIVSSEKYLRADSDYKTQLLKIKNSDAEGIYIIGYDNHALSILKQIQEMNLNLKIATNWIMASPNNIESAGDSAEGVYITTPKYYVSEDNKKISFEQKFSDKFDTNPDAYAALGYDTVYIIQEASQYEGNMISNLKNTEIQTLMGDVSSDSLGEMNFPLYPAKIENGNVVVIE